MTQTGEIILPLSELKLADILKLGNRLLGTENGKQLFRECGDQLTDEAIRDLHDGAKLFVHDKKYSDEQATKEISIAIFGPGAVGRSAITQRIINNTFAEDYNPTIEDLFEKTYQVDGNTVRLTILDTAGQEEFKGLCGVQTRGKDGYILTYSVIDRGSYDDLQGFYDTVMEVLQAEHSEMKPMILCGNKSDLSGHKISEQETRKRANQWKVTQHYDTSALNGHNIKV